MLFRLIRNSCTSSSPALLPTSFTTLASWFHTWNAPVAPDDYTVSRRTGSFLLIDPQTGGTLAAGMVRGFGAFDEAAEQAATVSWSI
jgi:sulfate adenylyltransferase subunit 1 (EFTu-like GTPase family)